MTGRPKRFVSHASPTWPSLVLALCDGCPLQLSDGCAGIHGQGLHLVAGSRGFGGFARETAHEKESDSKCFFFMPGGVPEAARAGYLELFYIL